jgi:clan AA aspartic protease (TIGR02281 family)
MDGTNPEAGVRYSKDVIYSSVLIISVVVTLAAGGAAYWYYWIRNDFSAVYAQLGISPLPLDVELDSNISKRLEQLRREPCYRDGMAWLASALIEAGYPREADTSLLNFAKRCGESEAILAWRHAALLKVSDAAAALDVANKLVESNPAIAGYRYMRAEAYEQLKNYDAALGDYIISVQLAGPPSRVIGSWFYSIARMHAALGRFCDAITDVETYVAFNPASRRTRQSDSMIIEYSKKGDCGISHAQGSARMPLKDHGGVKVLTATVNGVAGTFIVDSGATYLSVTMAFSDKAKINPNAAVRIPMQTANGIVQATIGTAGLVKVGNAEARNVTVAVNQNSSDPFGARIDGLLGMSFLARFNMQLGPDVIDLKVRNPDEGDASPAVQKNQNGPAKRTR